jgi:hypothetical protein
MVERLSNEKLADRLARMIAEAAPVAGRRRVAGRTTGRTTGRP